MHTQIEHVLQISRHRIKITDDNAFRQFKIEIFGRTALMRRMIDLYSRPV